MKINAFILPLFFLLLLDALTAKTVSAVTRVVVTQSALCSSVSLPSTCHTSVSDAIITAVAGDSIEIRPGTYTGNFALLNKNISSIYGLETAKTFLSGGGSGTILTIDTVTASMSVRRLSFINADTGISIRNAPSVAIKNNVFRVGAGGTAVQTINSMTATVVNNTFYKNLASIASDAATLNILNNIIFQNGNSVAITPSTMSQTSIIKNLFFNGTIGPTVVTDPLDPNHNIINENPLFVAPNDADIKNGDFHLLASSPCITVGNTSIDLNNVGDTSKTDIGAYGGSSDTIPFLVSGLASSATSSTPAIISLSWAVNNAYTTKGYNIYYGSASGVYNGTDAIVSGGTTTTASPIDAGNASTISLVVSRASVTPAAPAMNNPSPLNGSLQLSWSAVTGATGYNIYYSLASAPTLTFSGIPVQGTSYTLSGLTNGVFYNVLVKAVSQAVYYFAATAYDTNSTAGEPGVAHESSYSTERSVQVGNIIESGPSNVVTGMPESIIPNPNLPNTGCFIATAAYGSPSASAVQVLREFRDRRLLTNAPGRAFVRWYYAHSPAAAEILNAHPAWKPAVRTALAPAVVAALFLSRTTAAVQAIVLIILIAVTCVLLRRIRTRRSSTPVKETTR